MEPRSTAVRWPLWQRLAFRFLFCWFLLHSFPWPLSLLPGTGKAVTFYADHWNDLVTWIGAHVLHLAEPIAEQTNGSGDRLFSWVEMGCFMAFAALFAAVWSALDRKRLHYQTLHGWLRIFVRYELVTAMLAYGLYKVFPTQFPFPSAARLEERVGDLSPMGLLWTFMGYSPLYNLFAGLGEVVGGLLLVARRTTTLGALLLLGVLGNVVALNFSYDVPVKLYSSYLLLQALFLAAPDLGRLASLLVFNEPTERQRLGPPYSARGLLIGGFALKLAFVGYLLYTGLSGQRAMTRGFAEGPLHGGWRAESVLKEGQPVPPLATDASRWKLLFVTQLGEGPSARTFAQVQAMDDSRKPYGFVYDGKAGTLELSPRGGDPKAPPLKLTFKVEQADSNHLQLAGTQGGAPVVISLVRIDRASYLLVNRGFHWVNDFPFNR